MENGLNAGFVCHLPSGESKSKDALNFMIYLPKFRVRNFSDGAGAHCHIYTADTELENFS